MKLKVQVGDALQDVTVTRENGGYQVVVDGENHAVDARKLEGNFYSLLVDGRSYEVSVEKERDRYVVRRGAAQQSVTFADPSRRGRDLAKAAEGSERILSVMPGKVVRVLVAQGDAVQRGDGLLVVEAMKMENELAAPRDGTVASIEVEPGTAVEAGATLIVLE